MLAYIREDPSWNDQAFLAFSDLIAAGEPAFVPLAPGDLVLTVMAGGAEAAVDAQHWSLHRVFRVSQAEETGDALTYTLVQTTRIDTPASGPHRITREEFLRAHNWLPAPKNFFQALPTEVWTWLRETRGVVLPSAPYIWRS
jgi:hypothetical protein